MASSRIARTESVSDFAPVYEKRPATRSVFETSVPGGVYVAGSDRAVPRHLGGSP